MTHKEAKRKLMRLRTEIWQRHHIDNLETIRELLEYIMEHMPSEGEDAL